MKAVKRTILVVDDEAKVLDAFDLLFEDKYRLLTAANAAEAYKLIDSEAIDLVFLDISLPDEDGLSILKNITEKNEQIEVVMVTANNNVKTAVEAMRMGAKDYVVKPFEVDEILILTERILEGKQLLAEVAYLRETVKDPLEKNPVIGQSKAVKEIFETVKKICSNDSTVFITGESGTGKELVARAIHFSGDYRSHPFIPVNCGGIPDNLVESELFGHEKGSFTGATQKKLGKFELANNGTIFLDEVGNLKMEAQAKLLRVLQEQEVERVGGSYPIPVKVRVISATNIDLKKAVDEGNFREDLYYRLNVVQIHLPPLRERDGDIKLLVEHFLNYYSERFRKNIEGISKEAMDCFEGYSWPGNVRELRNVIERIVALTNKQVIDIKELPLDVLLKNTELPESFISNGLSLKEARDSFETQYITQLLEKTGWNQTKAADLLGVHRNTLINKMNELKIKIPD